MVFQGSLSLAYKFEEASKVSPLLYANVLVSFLIDVTAFGFGFSAKELVGCGVMVLFIGLFVI